MRILIVEDDHDLAMTISVALRRAGYEVDVATNGQEARSRWGRTPQPSLVLLDLMLPDASGQQLCRELRNSPITRDLPVLMLTARGEVEDRIAGLEAGADDYLTKPFHTKELLLRIEAILRRSERDDCRWAKVRRRACTSNCCCACATRAGAWCRR